MQIETKKTYFARKFYFHSYPVKYLKSKQHIFGFPELKKVEEQTWLIFDYILLHYIDQYEIMTANNH